MTNTKKMIGRRNEAIRRLNQGVESFNLWISKNPTLYIDFSKYDFGTRDLTNINFKSFKFKGCNFSSSICQNVDFSGSNLNNCDFTGVNCRDCNFTQARLVNANFTKADISGACFYASIMTKIILTDVICQNAIIKKPKKNIPEDLENFEPGEFESIYGTQLVKVVFKGGMKPIDLMALPFYVNKLLCEFPGKKIVFSGLSTLYEKTLEFRIENDINQGEEENILREKMQNKFDDDIPKIRDEFISYLLGNIELLNQNIHEKDRNMTEFTMKLIESKNYPNTIQHIFSNQVVIFNEDNSKQIFSRLQADMNLKEKILNELSELIKSAKGADKEIKELHKAILENSEKKFLVFLKKSGKKVLDISVDIGITLLTDFLKNSLQ